MKHRPWNRKSVEIVARREAGRSLVRNQASTVTKHGDEGAAGLGAFAPRISGMGR
jgi:hypothetical protein